MNDFKGRTAVITGGGSGIGRGMALRFARAGMNVVTADVEAAKATAVAEEVAALGVRSLGMAVDVRSRDAVAALARTARDTFGAVDVLCNNAGVSVRRRGIYATHEDWEWVLGVNLWGVIHGIECFLSEMLASGSEAHIVNTASINGLFPSAHSAMYSGSKFAVVGITETLHNELEGTKVSVSALCPAAVTTEIHNSERNRPPEVQLGARQFPPHVASSSFALSPALDRLAVGDLVLRGIERKLLYIHTDPAVRAIIQAHSDRILADFDPLDEWIAANPQP